jgi:eukaryotic-like serine/threonine-protein kinase
MSQHSATGDWSAPRDPDDALLVPGYEILEELGRGGMGVVYKARQVNLQRLVALKLIRDGALAGPRERARFRIEAEAAARLRHPNVVQIYDAGDYRGQPYFAMELVEGGTLAQHIADQPQPALWAAGLVQTLALAVQHAHEHHVIHRDLKPSNILLVSGGLVSGEWSSEITTHHSPLTTHQPKIADFGLAKRLDSESTVLTQDSVVLGTASYMAPEQAAGKSSEIGPGVDVYALGAILYELLTGTPPFEADSWNATVERVLRDEPTPATQLRPDVPRDLETICLKCLEKEPGRRYASARELADDLGRFLESRPVTAVPLDAKERVARLAARDGYELAEEIGRGPRSTVYRALHGPLKQPVALKVFSEGTWTQDEWEARLRRGADLWSALAHPNIVSVQRGGWWQGMAYLAVEYVAHGSLATRLSAATSARRARVKIEVAETLRLVEQLAEIVSYIHRQGLVHGNLKPSNVLFAADGIPRVADFRLTCNLSRASVATEDREVIGLGYLAPELARDPSADLRPHTDVYGLGIILYELLTGRPPFAATSAQEVLEQVRSQEPVAPSRFNSKVTPHLDAFCLRCLKKNAWRRYARAYDVLTRLRYFQENAEDQAMPGERRRMHRPRGPEEASGTS